MCTCTICTWSYAEITPTQSAISPARTVLSRALSYVCTWPKIYVLYNTWALWKLSAMPILPLSDQWIRSKNYDIIRPDLLHFIRSMHSQSLDIHNACFVANPSQKIVRTGKKKQLILYRSCGFEQKVFVNSSFFRRRTKVRAVSAIVLCNCGVT